MGGSFKRGVSVVGVAVTLLAIVAGPSAATTADDVTTTTTSPVAAPPAQAATPSTVTTTTTPTAATPSTTSTTTTIATTTTTTTTTVAPTVGANGVTANKTLTVAVTGTTGAAPNVWAGDVDAALSVTILNTSSSQALGSVNLTVPAPYTLVAAPADTVPGGPVVELRNLSLAPGSSTVIELVVGVHQCTSGSPAPFAVTAKQSNDYNGVGNDFTLVQPSDLQVDVVGTCMLAWLAQPADAERGATITSEAWNPNGAPLVVEVRDGGLVDRAALAIGTVALAAANAGVASPTFGGTTSATIAAGLATFAPGPTLAPSAFDYVLTASSTNLTGTGPSAPFDIVDEQVNCPAGGSCEGSASVSSGQFSVSAAFGSGVQDTDLTVSLNAADIPSFACAGYPRNDLPVAQFVFTNDAGGDRLGTLSTSIVNASRPLKSYEVCWAAPYTFTTKSGGRSAVGASKPGTGEPQPLYVGLLPDCPKRGTVVLPCVSERSYEARTRTVTIVVRATGDDPWKY